MPYCLHKFKSVNKIKNIYRDDFKTVLGQCCAVFCRNSRISYLLIIHKKIANLRFADWHT